MTRVLTNQLAKHVGETVTIQGWLHKKRLLGGLNFITLRDRAGVAQTKIDNKDEVEKLRGMQIGTVLTMTGVVVADERAPGGAELHDVTLEVVVPVLDESPIEIDKKLDHKSENLDTLFEHRVIGLRNLQETAIFRVQAAVKEAVRQYFHANDFTEFNSPKLLPAATEGGAEVFTLDYFGKEATLAQSGQFYKQMMVGVFERAYEINPTYRAEPSATTRHMTEFLHIDAEMGFVDFQELLSVVGGLLKSVAASVWEQKASELESLQAKPVTLPESIPQLTLEKIHELYSEATGQDTRGEKDLRPDEERWITEYAKENLGSEAVFVTEWPASEMKFYHRKSAENPEFAERADLIFRGVEIATISMREHRYDVLVEQLRTIAGGDPEADGFRYYLQAFRYGLPPHGGFGMGLERLTQKIIGLANVKEAALFPRDINRLTP
ncbi:aspartate--tRNA(Asn) ligase [Candidatus Saccharibacteria bacterium]|nr:aspartate--tRNA(Asn) ligase [Candidatus Saccharibacteria bacterium]MBJ58462.1 aspartate--tRNA(Asn) ligase [Candidatus Saccharibacteria bacterium]MBQ68666.1 aspartate--tRNA(Asn) ligase [Candidatus Saccharibacteria bacterium]|tara:strand:+ start:243 stop:1556 length:1314 start_codon:yes stop_codon:yes gene_type:complete